MRKSVFFILVSALIVTGVYFWGFYQEETVSWSKILRREIFLNDKSILKPGQSKIWDDIYLKINQERRLLFEVKVSTGSIIIELVKRGGIIHMSWQVSDKSPLRELIYPVPSDANYFRITNPSKTQEVKYWMQYTIEESLLQMKNIYKYHGLALIIAGFGVTSLIFLRKKIGKKDQQQTKVDVL